MAAYIQEGISIVGMSACVPRNKENNLSNPIFASVEDAQKFIDSTGVVTRRVADKDTCTSDLCYKAAKELLHQLQWSSEDVGLLICITQTPDFHGPMNSTLMQHRLNLSMATIAFDIPIGCSGFIYGTSVISSMMKATGISKALLMVGDTLTKQASPKDKSTQPLFGDAATVTAFEMTGNLDDKIYFDLGNDGGGYESLYIKEGAYRFPFNEDSLRYKESEGNISRNGCHTIMEGMDVFTFGISTAPKTFKNVQSLVGIEVEKIDYAVFHQANKFMNEKIRKKLNLNESQVPYSLQKFGNTSSATIPLTMISELGPELSKGGLNVMMCGFGIGLSWGTMFMRTSKIVCLPIIEY